MRGVSSGDRHLRDHPRGLRVSGGPGIKVGIQVSESVVATVHGQLVTLMLVNLLARQFGVVHTVSLRASAAPACERLRKVNPTLAGQFPEFLDHLAASVSGVEGFLSTWAGEDPDLWIIVGPDVDPRAMKMPAVAVYGDDWTARATTSGSLEISKPSSASWAFGCFLAGCLGAAFAFRVAAQGRHAVEVELSLWEEATRKPPRGSVVLPNFYLLGAGAVGAAFMYCLAWAGDVQGRAIVVDPQSQSETDRNRLVSGEFSTVGADKVALIDRMMAHSDLKVFPNVGRWPDEYVLDASRQRPAVLSASEAEDRYEWIISAVDRNRDRRGIANYLPRHVLSGSTDGLAAQTAYYSVQGEYECLACNHPVADLPGLEKLRVTLSNMSAVQRTEWMDRRGANPETRAAIDEFLSDPACGGLGEMELARLGREGEVDWSVGFVSVAAGVLLCANFVRCVIEGVPKTMSSGSERRLLFSTYQIVDSQARRKPECPVCGDAALRQRWADLWGEAGLPQ